MDKKNSPSLFECNSEDVRSGRIELEKQDKQKKAPAGKTSGKTIYIVVVLAVSLLLALLLSIRAISCANEGLVLELSVDDVSPAGLSDGVYTADYTSSHLYAKVSVSVSEGYIVDISLDSFRGIDTARAQMVFDAVIAAQSPAAHSGDVGTEPTDVILLKAVQAAIEGGYAQ